MRITRTITVDGTDPAAVYAYLKDFTNSEQWDPGTVETTLVEGDGGVGSRYHNRSVFRGKETELTYETVDLQPDRLVVMRGENRTVVAVDTMSISPGPDGTGTVLVYEANFTFKGLAKLATPFLRGQLTTLGDDAEAALDRELPQL
ncbi:SRPBCC family protein [Janibacter cremeus]|uniref:SRPBCC family protein n=1 Tax=Janibacter cremeus TaxID=1285192 RepID=UPI0023F7C56C|nr:SRPBCC family protein [Janibacter cremeus]WEV76918.1 SRPBCC family protein [Janibacter cremeus]